MRKHHRRMAAVAAAALLAAAAGPATALAVPAENYPRPVPETGAQTPSEFAQPVTSAPVGDTKFDAPGTSRAAAVGDTKVDAPGASRAPRYEPASTIEIVRPERTIVRDADPALPIVLAGLALLIAVGAGGTALVGVRSLRVGRAG